ncbi:MAG TPA: archease [Pirellulales bacterium]|nr:archease [Pirellulales bacterium]
MYETFEHTADLGLRVTAADLPTLFAEAGRGLTSIIVANLDDVRPVREMSFAVPGTQLDELLFDWLDELLYAFETQRLLFAEFDVSVDDAGLKAAARGETADETRHRLEHEVKAITYHGLKVERTPEGYLAEVIVDI